MAQIYSFPINAVFSSVVRHDCQTGLDLSADNIHVHYDREGKASGEAFVQFHSSRDCEMALKRNMEKIGFRWVRCSILSIDYDRNNVHGPM